MLALFLVALSPFICVFVDSQQSYTTIMADLWVNYARWTQGKEGRVGYRILNAFKAGTMDNNSTPIYICRWKYEDRHEVGYLNIRTGNCNAGWGGYTLTSSTYEVLINPLKEYYRWKWESSGRYPPGALIVGFLYRRPMFACKIHDGARDYVGELNMDGGCYIPKDGRDVWYRNYLVLSAYSNNSCPP